MSRATRIAALLLAAACATRPPAPDAWKMVRSGEYVERVSLLLDSADWKVGNQHQDATAHNMELVRSNEQIGSWTELVSLGTYLGAQTRVTPPVLAASLREHFEQTCAGVEWSIVTSRQTDVTYEFRHQGCEGHPAQHEISRLVTGITGIHRIAYVKRVPQLDDDTRAAWLVRIQSARVSRRRIDELRKEDRP